MYIIKQKIVPGTFTNVFCLRYECQACYYYVSVKQCQILRMRGIKPRLRHSENCPAPLQKKLSNLTKKNREVILSLDVKQVN